MNPPQPTTSKAALILSIIFSISAITFAFYFRYYMDHSTVPAKPLKTIVENTKAIPEKTEPKVEPKKEVAPKAKEYYSQPAVLSPINYLNFAFNYFDSDYEVKYPEVLRDMPVSNYAEVKCMDYRVNSDFIEKGVTENILLSVDYQEEYSYEDKKIIDFLIALKDQEENRFYIETITHCEANDKDIVLYDIPRGGGGMGTSIYVGYLDSELVEIPNKEPYGGPYFNCSETILSTKDEKFFIKCGAGDGGFGSRSIIEVDLKNSTFKPAISCIYTAGEETTDEDGNTIMTQEHKCTE